MICAPPPRFSWESVAAAPSEAGGAAFGMLRQEKALSPRLWSRQGFGFRGLGPQRLHQRVCGAAMACAALAQAGLLDLGRVETQTLLLRGSPAREARRASVQRSCSLSYLLTEVLARMLLSAPADPRWRANFSDLIYIDPRIFPSLIPSGGAFPALKSLGSTLANYPCLAGSWWGGSESPSPAKPVALTDALLGPARPETLKLAQAAHMACFGPIIPIRRRVLKPGETEDDLLRPSERSETPFLRFASGDLILALWPNRSDLERACKNPSDLIARALIASRKSESSQLFDARIKIAKIIIYQFGGAIAERPVRDLLRSRGGYGKGVIDRLAFHLQLSASPLQNVEAASLIAQAPERERREREARCLTQALPLGSPQRGEELKRL